MSQNGSPPRFEFRVRWQREGRPPTYRIYQTEAAAREKVDGILALEEVKGDSSHFEDMPDLVGPPELQAREVGEWRAADRGAPEKPSEKALEGVAAWAGVGWDDGGSGIY